MTTPQPFSLRIFVADGDPDGLRLVERSNWIGKALVFPRKLYPEVRNRSEFQQTGVYLLLDGEGETIYIGEFTPGPERPVECLAGPESFDRVVFFTACGGPLNQAHAQYLASRLVGLAKKAKKVKSKGCDDVPEPMLSVADQADMEAFLDNMLVVLPPAGVGLFEEVRSKANKGQASVVPPVVPSSTSDAAKNRGDTGQAAKMEKFIRSLLKPSKRNLGVASCMGIALVLIQCAGAGYLPEFDWKSGAGAVALVAVLTVSVFTMLVLTLCMALPALPTVTESKEAPRSYVGASILLPLWLALLVGVLVLFRSSKWVGDFWNSTAGAVVFLILVLGPVVGFSLFSAYKESDRKPKAGWWDYIKRTVNCSFGFGMMPAAFFLPYAVLAKYGEKEPSFLVYFGFLQAAVVVLLNISVLDRKRTPAMCVMVAAVIFGVFAKPASDVAFSLLGLGGRRIEFYLENPKYAAALKLGGMEADSKTGDLYNVYLRLRLGSEIAVSADGNEWGPAANVVAIPRDAIRGLRFVPPAPKSADGTKDTQKPATGATSPTAATAR